MLQGQLHGLPLHVSAAELLSDGFRELMGTIMTCPSYTYITDTTTLASVVRSMVGQRMIAVDTEADSMHHYREKVCLIQLSIPGASYIVDPLAFQDLSPLMGIFGDSKICKVFHGADYDIRSLHRDFAFEIRPIFDTMVACQFLGEKENGLAAILKRRFNVELDKKYQKADWSRRPLEQEMIAYAVTDTSLLIQLACQLEEELRKIGRYSWFEEECQLLAGVRAAERCPEPMFMRFKGASRIQPRGLAVLEQVLMLRDSKAQQRDLPPFKILQNEMIKEIAERKPLDRRSLDDIPGMSPRIAERYGRDIIAAVSRAIEMPEHQLPHFPREQKPQRDSAFEKRVKSLKEWREKKAADLAMDPGIVANNLLLEALAARQPHSINEVEAVQGVKRWQVNEFATEWLALLR
jgi:ribonuclease D